MRKFSIVVPVYNRPQEVEELLESLAQQDYPHLEVRIVEDGSVDRCEEVVARYANQLEVHYTYKENTGQGFSRNFGWEESTGDYLITFDSDVIVPQGYFEAVNAGLDTHGYDAFGGPDTGHASFTRLQRAMGYTMNSPFTTGGIRGGKVPQKDFQPRGFNMGLSPEAFQKTGGFHYRDLAEDIDLALRMKALGLKVGLIPEAGVFHKRRTSLKKFFWQVFNFGRGRVLNALRHKGAIKLVHWFPTFFLLACIGWALSPLVSLPLFYLGSALLTLYLLVIGMHATVKEKNLAVGGLSVFSALIQLLGYGSGFLKEYLRKVRGRSSQ
ncbi:MAG TPA: glycosyltransferase [Cytophagales bacterium]|nr:glycosyltransferase [Cytophagales bacterium]HAA23233.1 glycosyltransferase [Cytophagales bacterium]HAP58478.1 glycosyltransferase [Cytophagales bacterium]